MKEQTPRQRERQDHRDRRSGRYEKFNPCEVCGRSMGDKYYSDDRCNNVFRGRGLVLCGFDAERLARMTDADGCALLGVS